MLLHESAFNTVFTITDSLAVTILVHLLQNTMGSQICSTKAIVLSDTTPDISQPMAIDQSSHFKQMPINVLTQACLQHAYNHIDAQEIASFQALKVLLKLYEFLPLQDQHNVATICCQPLPVYTERFADIICYMVMS